MIGTEIVDVTRCSIHARGTIISLYRICEIFDEIMNLLGRESVYSGHFDNEWREISQK